MKVLFIREMDNGRVRIGVGVDECTAKYSVSAGVYNESGIVRGCELDEETLAMIEEDDTVYRAMRRALSLLSYGDNTKLALRRKLIRSGFSPEVADAIVGECLMLGYINEHRQIERAVLNEANRSLRGRIYIRNKLRAKGYSVGDIDTVIDGLVDAGEIDFGANFERLAEKRGANDEESRRALAYKYGYSTGYFD